MKWRWLANYVALGTLLALVGLGLSLGLIALLSWLLPAVSVTAVLFVVFGIIIVAAAVILWRRYRKF